MNANQGEAIVCNSEVIIYRFVFCSLSIRVFLRKLARWCACIQLSLLLTPHTRNRSTPSACSGVLKIVPWAGTLEFIMCEAGPELMTISVGIKLSHAENAWYPNCPSRQRQGPRLIPASLRNQPCKLACKSSTLDQPPETEACSRTLTEQAVLKASPC
jgi:hypothetical protein